MCAKLEDGNMICGSKVEDVVVEKVEKIDGDVDEVEKCPIIIDDFPNVDNCDEMDELLYEVHTFEFMDDDVDEIEKIEKINQDVDVVEKCEKINDDLDEVDKSHEEVTFGDLVDVLVQNVVSELDQANKELVVYHNGNASGDERDIGTECNTLEHNIVGSLKEKHNSVLGGE